MSQTQQESRTQQLTAAFILVGLLALFILSLAVGGYMNGRCPTTLRPSQPTFLSYPNQLLVQTQQNTTYERIETLTLFTTTDSPATIMNFYKRDLFWSNWRYAGEDTNYLAFRDDRYIPLYGVTLSLTPTLDLTYVEVRVTPDRYFRG